MTGNASARARLGRLGRRNQGQNNKHNQYGPYHDDRSVYIHRACLARGEDDAEHVVHISEIWVKPNALSQNLVSQARWRAGWNPASLPSAAFVLPDRKPSA